MFWWLLCDGSGMIADHVPALLGPGHICVRYDALPLCNDEPELS